MKYKRSIRITTLLLYFSLLLSISVFGQKEIKFNSLEEYMGTQFRRDSIQVYCANGENAPCFSYVYKVENSPGLIEIYGKGKDDIIHKAILSKLKSSDIYYLVDREGLGFWNYPSIRNYLKNSLSIISIPIKIRPAVGNLDTKGTSGLSNVGMNLSILTLSGNKYYSDGEKSLFGVTLGYMAAPSVEELKASEMEVSEAFSGNTSKQFFISHGLTITFNYNNLFFSYVPIGFDNGTNTIGKNWIFDNRRWWGFGLGIKFQALKDLVGD